MEQALADYAILIYWFKQNTAGADSSAVIAFGGCVGCSNQCPLLPACTCEEEVHT